MSTATISTLSSPEERAILTNVKRRVNEEFPDFGRLLLANPLKRNMFENMLVGLLKHANDPTLEQCMVRVQKAGYTVTRGTGMEPRYPHTYRSAEAISSPSINPGSQRHRMLTAWWDVGEEGATSEEACKKAGMSMRSCYWARATELQQGGYIEAVESDDGTPYRRKGESGTYRQVFRITPLGSETLLSLL